MAPQTGRKTLFKVGRRPHEFTFKPTGERDLARGRRRR